MIRRDFPSVLDSAYDQYLRDLPLLQTAEKLMSPDVVKVAPEISLNSVAKIMGQKHIGSVIVEKYKTPVGIVTERDLLSKVIAFSVLLKDETVEGVMSYPLAGIDVTTKIKEIAKQMIEKKGRLGVFDAGTLVGVVSASDLIKSLPDVSETEVKVDDYMTKEVITADEKTFVADIAKTMGQKRIGSVIITRKGEPFAIFTERDLLTNFLAQGKQLFTQVGPASSQPLITIGAGISVHRAAATMAIKHIRRLPVVKNGKLEGIITARDLVEAYAK